MIRFKCIYCGQRVLAPDNGADKKGKCPKCGHELVVPKSTKGRPAISPNKEPIPERPKQYVPEWDKGPRFGPDEPAEALTELFKESFGFLIPTYDKLSLLLMVITLILLFTANSQMREQVFVLAQRDLSRELLKSFYPEVHYLRQFYFLFLFFIITLPFQVFFKSNASFAKKVILFFAVLINALTGIIAGVHAVRNTSVSNWLLIFPIWNIINCFLLLLMLFFNLIDEDCISERKATPFRIIFGLVSILIIFTLCNYVFKMHWAITFSICIVYTTSFDRAIQGLLPGLAYRQGTEDR